ncbi:MAG TPA: bifunctional phosphopantothenoylcysteine decarboxylase/phosphopantothenate--cysteine ligase CoaBC [Polyangia bacterium]|nr:bifunctional phosphopantothenoylcysteine decarboxylase/phosphopantothenate--cysteine ligase CoaBC [Polyangia bacterium]
MDDFRTDGSDAAALAGRRIVLGVTGGIAAYKAAELCRLLIKAGATVRVVMTDAATRFITPLTLQTLSGAPVGRDLFDLGSEAEIGHIKLADEAELLIVAPATADAIARLAAGMANDLLTAVALATRAPLLLAPAMNVNMWENPLVRANLARLLGPEGGGRISTVGPDRGALACGWVGAGRLIEPSEIVTAAARLLAPGDLAGRRVVVTAGPTREPVDDVRFLGNRSSGKMGAALAAAAAARGAAVTLLAGPGTPAVAPGAGGLSRVEIETAAELEQALAAAAPGADAVVMAAAVADFRPRARAEGKLSRRTAGEGLTLELAPVPDLLAGVARARRNGRPFLIGFSAEVAGGAALEARAAGKLREKGCDAIVANDVSAPGIGFDADDNAVTVLFADGARVEIPRAAKPVIAERLWTLFAPRLRPEGSEPDA